MKRIVIVILCLLVYGWHVRFDRQQARQIRLLQGEVVELKRLMDGALEQTNEQADQIAVLETAIHDVATGESHYYSR